MAYKKGIKSKAEIVANTAHLIIRKGITSTSIRDISDEAGVSIGALTHHFSSKEELINTALRALADDYRIENLSGLQAKDTHPKKRLESFFSLLLESYCHQMNEIGCGFGIVLSDIDAVSDEIRLETLGLLEETRSAIEVALIDSGRTHQVARNLSILAIDAWQGCIQRARAEKDGSKAVRECFASIVSILLS